MKTLFKIFIALISVVLLTTIPERTHSCGPVLEVDAERFALFRSEITEDDGLMSYHYTHAYLNGGPAVGNDYKRNCEEWHAYTNSEAIINDIYKIQYETKPDAFLYAYNTRDWSDFADNTFAQWLVKRKNKAALDYMATAKRIEFDQMESYEDPWDDGSKSGHADIVGYPEIVEKLEQPMPEFLRQRYAFQAVKLVYYLNHRVEPFTYDSTLITLYDRYLKNKNTVVADWGMLYYAFSQPTRTERNLYLLRTFDRSDEKKHYAYQWLNVADMDTLGDYVTAKDDKLMVQVMKAIMTHDRALEKIKEVYAADPDSKYLPLLITREINKLEDWIWSPEMIGFVPGLKAADFSQGESHSGKDGDVTSDTSYEYYLWKNVQKDRLYLADVRQALQEMLHKGGINKDFLRISLAHLSNMERDPSSAIEYLKQVKATDNRIYARQLAIEHMIAAMYAEDITKNGTKQKLLNQIKMLKETGVNVKPYDTYEYYSSQEPEDDMEELLIMLAKRYKAKGDIVTAALLMQKINMVVNEYTGGIGEGATYGRISYFDRYGMPADIDEAVHLKHKANKTPFELYIAEELKAPDDYYLDLKGTMLVRENKFHEALEVFHKMDDSFWVSNYDYSYLPAMYIGSVGTYLPGPLGARKQYSLKSKKLIVEDIVQLEDALKTAVNKEQKAQLLFTLANAHFNMTFGGKAWMVYSYGKSGHDHWWYNYDWTSYNFSTDDPKKMAAYYKFGNAMPLYRQAMALTKNKELAAKCLLMLGYCDKRNSEAAAYVRSEGITYSRDMEAYKSPYLKTLARKYCKTNTYYYALGSCPDVQ